MRDRLLPVTRRMSLDVMIAACVTAGVHVYTRRLPDPYMGFYDEAVETIVLDESLNQTQGRCTLVHELMHWVRGDVGCGVGERRVRRMTAGFMVDRDEYAMAEVAFEGDVWRMSVELGVTVGVLDDYRLLLRESGVRPVGYDWV